MTPDVIGACLLHKVAVAVVARRWRSVDGGGGSVGSVEANWVGIVLACFWAVG
jgi:hypothetical protein